METGCAGFFEDGSGWQKAKIYETLAPGSCNKGTDE